MYYATLIKGKDYRVSGINFLIDEEREVNEDLHSYLSKSPVFSVRTEVFVPKKDEVKEDTAATSIKDEAKELTIQYKREELNALAEELDLNPDDYKTELQIAKAIVKAEKELEEKE